MHELSLCQAIARTVSQRAGERGVARVTVRIGHLRQVVPDALIFSWEILTAGSPLDGSILDVEQVPATVECSGCAAVTRLDLPVLVCATCGSHDVTLLTGEEFMLVSFETATAPTDEPQQGYGHRGAPPEAQEVRDGTLPPPR